MLMSITIFAQAENGKRSDQIASMKMAYLTKALELTPEESQKFWPIYNSYSDKMKAMKESARPKFERAEDLSDKEAQAMIYQQLDLEQARVDLRRSMVQDFKGVISNRKILKLYRAEDRFKKEVLARVKERMGEHGQRGPRGQDGEGRGPRG